MWNSKVRDEATATDSPWMDEVGGGMGGLLVADRPAPFLPVRPPARPNPGISVVIPVYNSETTIEPLCEDIIRDLEPTQIVLVDDGSSDGSANACLRAHRRHPAVVEFIGLGRNFGEHNAVMAGLNRADGDYCVIMDDDMQNPSGEAARLVSEIRKGYDVVYVRYATKHHSWFRNLGSRFHNWIATLVLHKPADLYLSSFKVLSRFVVREAVNYSGPDPYLDAIILRATRRIGVIDARHESRREGKSGYTIGKLVSLWGNMVVAFSLYPVRLIGIYGLVMVLVGISVAIWTLLAYLSPELDDRPDSLQRLTASMWFFRGVHLFFLSIVAEYVGRIYRRMSREPQFTVREVRRRTGTVAR
jgi:undecaprenyl-phosphate 4-deoxy-4-formamido-L-arabinose transferase